LKAFTKDGTPSEDAMKFHIKEIREQAKIKAEFTSASYSITSCSRNF